MTLRLPRADTRIYNPDGSFSREWYKSLTDQTKTVNSIIAGETIYTDTGTVNAMVISSGVASYSRGLTRFLLPAFTNTNVSVTLNDSGLGAEFVKFPNGTQPAVGQIVAGVTLEVIYNGTYWEIQNLQTVNQSVLGNLTVTGTLDVTGAVTGHSTISTTGAISSSGAGVSASTTVTAGTYAATGVVAVGSLPSAVGIAGARYMVNNANATTFASVVAAGGANVVPVYSDGSVWRIG